MLARKQGKPYQHKHEKYEELDFDTLGIKEVYTNIDNKME
jgi:hypothetical protein